LRWFYHSFSDFFMHFASDNTSGVAPEVLDGIVRANVGYAPSYGADELTKRAEKRLADLFETELAMFLVGTGTAANSLGLAAFAKPHEAIFCHETSHIYWDECAAPEFYTGGSKLMPVAGDFGKLQPDAVRRALSFIRPGFHHQAQPAVLSLSQLTEFGTAYRPEEIKALSAVARERGMAVHMDGARFANAVVFTEASPAELTWKSGVDVMSFGASKNGAMGVEAVIVFETDRVGALPSLRKRAGQLFSKGRFLAAQMDAYLTDGLWHRHAAHANAMAHRLDDGLRAIPGVEISYPVEGNEVFCVLPKAIDERLRAAGAVYHPWQAPGDSVPGDKVRLVTSFVTRPEDVERFLEVARRT
jgi:threonine aldolase